MKCLIISSGKISNPVFLEGYLNSSDFIICADGGANHLFGTSYTPDLIIGDLDSITPETRTFFEHKKTPFVICKKEKDESDTELALCEAFRQNPVEIIMIGATGTRLDHTLANIMLLKKGLKKKIPMRIVDEHNEVFLTDKKIKIEGKKDQLLSIIPLTEDVAGVYTKGLKYPLKDYQMEQASSLGISNVFIGINAEITIKSGVLMILKSKD